MTGDWGPAGDVQSTVACGLLKLALWWGPLIDMELSPPHAASVVKLVSLEQTSLHASRVINRCEIFWGPLALNTPCGRGQSAARHLNSSIKSCQPYIHQPTSRNTKCATEQLDSSRPCQASTDTYHVLYSVLRTLKYMSILQIPQIFDGVFQRQQPPIESRSIVTCPCMNHPAA